MAVTDWPASSLTDIAESKRRSQERRAKAAAPNGHAGEALPSLRAIAAALGGVVSGNGVLAPGPDHHSPHDRSLSVTPDAKAPGGFLVHSFAGDDELRCKDYVREKLGLPGWRPQERRREPAKKPAQTAKRIVVARFDYHNAQGAVVYQVERVEFRNPDGSYVLKDGKHEKKFLLRRPDPDQPGEWISGHGCMAVVPRVPYRLPELLEALAHGRTVAIVEGEAKAELLWKWGIPATCNSEGHGSVKNWADHAKYFKAGDQIVALPDNDQAGRDHVNTVAANLTERGATVRILDLPVGQKGDVIDWHRGGGTVEQLHDLIEREARAWAPKEPPSERIEGNRAAFAEAGATCREQEPRKITASPYVWRDPKTIPRREFLYGKFYARKFISTMIAAGGIGKTSLALVEAIAMATGRSLLGVPVPKRLRVWYWNGEDPKEETERRIAAILLHFKIAPEEIEGWLFTDSGRETPICIAEPHKNGVIFGPDAKALSEEITAKRIDVFILDPFVKTHGVSENINVVIDRVARKFADIADEADCAIGLAHHVRKASGNGRAEVTIDDARGAGSLVDAARSNRVLNVMTTDEAEAAQVKPEQRKSYFRADDGKANMAPPAENATWFKIVSIGLGNHEIFELGDFVGVVTSWALPGVFVGVNSGRPAKSASGNRWRFMGQKCRRQRLGRLCDRQGS